MLVRLHTYTQYACIVIADLSQRLAQSGGIRAPRNEPEASTDNRSHQSTGLHPSIPGRLAHLLHSQYLQASHFQIQAAPRTRKVKLVLISTPTSRTLSNPNRTRNHGIFPCLNLRYSPPISFRSIYVFRTIFMVERNGEETPFVT